LEAKKLLVLSLLVAFPRQDGATW